MKLTSPAFENNGFIPKVYTCHGKEISPPLEIRGVPEGTKSLSLIMDDPDVPKNLRKDGMWVHWVVFNIDPNVTKIAEDTANLGVLGKNTGGKNAYQGPCPPDREHRYFLKLYALDILLDLEEGASKEELLKCMEGHILAKTELIGRSTPPL